MKILCMALMFVAISAAAEPPASQSATPATPDASQATATDSPWTPSRDTDAPDDDSSNESWNTSSNGLNYETGEVCLTRGAGGICLESTDD